jgi:hypothetical protein
MDIDKKTEGAWLVHHSNKLQGVDGAVDFQEIEFAGKCGILLSALAADTDATLPKKRVQAIAKAAKLNVHTELPAILEKLEERHLIDQSESGIAVLGLTTSTVLGHTSDIFQSTEPSAEEKAALFLAEETSKSPLVERQLSQQIQDTFHLLKDASDGLLEKSASIGFVDAQAVDAQTRIVFNGNLFRVDNAQKVESVLRSLSQADQRNMAELESMLQKKGCIEEPEARKVLGDTLFDKLHSIGVFDLNGVSNDKETTYYVTRPGAFGKYGNTIAEDALDLAKALVASLSYGMTKSVHSRGKIVMLNALLSKLIRGEITNPCTAAGQDYNILETRGVIAAIPAGRNMFSMKLLKREVGVHARNILNFGDTSEDSLPLPGASVTTFKSPEENRSIKRKKMKPLDKAITARLLDDIRTGAFK